MCTTTQWLTVLSRCFIESSDDIIIIIFADIDFQVLISSSSSSSCPPQRKWRVIKLLLLTESVTFQPKLSKTYCSVCRYEIQWRRVSCQKVGMKSGNCSTNCIRRVFLHPIPSKLQHDGNAFQLYGWNCTHSQKTNY